jgi:AMME syndrome candidate gene 1 protein
MCHHCFDVLLHQLKKDQHHHQQTSKKSGGGGVIGAWRGLGGGGGGGGNLTKSSPTAAATSITQPAATFVDGLPHENVECPLFVTWERKRPLSRFHMSSSSSKHNNSNDQQQQNNAAIFELRGCIGTLSPRPLATSIGEYALISAFKDKRFDPVRWTEVPHLRVAVSLLVQYEECRNCHDWHVGVHGIVIRWREGDSTNAAVADSDVCRQTDDKDTASNTARSTPSNTRAVSATSVSTTTGRDYSATYLPEVAADQGWDQQTTVSSLIRKAGFHGPISDDLLARVQCTRYQSSKHRLTFEEYIQQSQAAAAQQVQSQQQQQGQGEHTSSSPSSPTMMTPLSNDQLVAEAIRELGQLPRLQGGGGASTSSLSPHVGDRDVSPPTCRVL